MKNHSKYLFSFYAGQKSLSSSDIPRRGFALISTITLMVLLVLLAVAMLSLSTIESRSAGFERDNEIARSNARISLMIAIGRLQETAGADTRITASADAVAGLTGGTRQLTGVWRSWEGLNHDSEGRPITPDYSSKLDKGDLNDSSSEGRFLTWLVSSAEDEDISSIPDLISPADGVDRVMLLGSQTSAIFDKVNVDTTLIKGDNNEVTGSYAWWIQGNNSKAFLRYDDKSDPETPEEWSRRLASYNFSNSQQFDILNDEDLSKGDATFNTLSFLRDGIRPLEHVEDFYDLTSFAPGLLTNVATGGWKRDLSLFSEKYSDDERNAWGQGLAQNGLSTFNLTTDQIHETGLISTEGGYLYPWVSDENICMSWSSLADFASLYKKVQVEGANSPYFNITSYEGEPDLQSHDRFNIVEPILSRNQFILAYSSEAVGDEEPVRYNPVLAVKPTLVYFNPYNIAIDSSTFISERQILRDAQDVSSSSPDPSWPFKFSLTIGGVTYDVDRTTHFLGNRRDNGMNLDTWFQVFSRIGNFSAFEDLDIEFRWKPGESKVLGIAERELNGNILDAYNFVTRMMGGFNTEAAYSLQLNTTRADSRSIVWPTPSAPPTFLGSDTMGVEISYSGATTLPILFDRNTSQLHASTRNPFLENSYPRLKALTTVYDPANLANTLPLVSLRPSSAFSDIEHPIFEPFLSFSYGLRSLTNTLVKTKGYASHKQVIPLNFTKENIADTDISHSVFDWKIDPIGSSADLNNFSDQPNFSSNQDTSAYLGSSGRADFGVNRWPIAELPTQPLLSLCELQHFDPAFLNYHYPLVSNAIGNSHASPFIGPDATRVTNTNGLDHSYIANHLLWDDWCLTSLAPRIENYAVTTDLDTVFTEVFSGEETLLNEAYRPSLILTTEDAEAKMEEYRDAADSWENVASEFVIDGMFNINSTSVPAWTALLSSQLKNNPVFQEIDPANRGSTPIVDILGDGIASVSRFTLNSDKDSTTAIAGSGAHNAITAPQEWTIDDFENLAEEIVEQIRLRGPFLSLSEFMNRQLSSDEDLALAGVVEAALLEYADQGDSPYDGILDEYSGSEFEAQEHDTYQFSKAGEGHVYYGTPGWARQADILRPIASVLSARDDTFTVRGYGDSRDRAGKVISRAWCEAIVSRNADFVDQSDEPSAAISEISEVNRKNGRRFRVVLFRWLSSEEI